MKVELQRDTKDRVKSVRLVADDTARTPETLSAWIRMLQLAERWLRDRPKPDEAKP